MERILHYKDLVKDVLQSAGKPTVFQKSILTSGVLTDEDTTYAERIYSPSISNFKKDARDYRIEYFLIFAMILWSVFSNFLWNFKIEINFILIVSIFMLWISPSFFERPLTTNMEVLFGLTTVPPTLILGNIISFFYIRIVFNIPILGFIMAFFIYKIFIMIGFFYQYRLLKAVVEEEAQASRLIKALTNIDYFSTIKKENEVHLKYLEVRENIVENLKGKMACFRLMKDLISKITIYKTGAPDVYESAQDGLRNMYCNYIPQDFLAKRMSQFWGFVSIIQSETFLELFLCLQQPFCVHSFLTTVFTFYFLCKTSVVQLMFSSESFKKRIIFVKRKQHSLESTECDRIFNFLIPLNEAVIDSNTLPEDRTLLIDSAENILNILTDGEFYKRKKKLKQDMNEDNIEDKVEQYLDEEPEVLNQQYEKITEDVKAFIENKGIIEGWLKSNINTLQLDDDDEEEEVEMDTGEDKVVEGSQLFEDDLNNDDSRTAIISSKGFLHCPNSGSSSGSGSQSKETEGGLGIKHELLDELFKSPKSPFSGNRGSTFYE